MTSSSSLPSSIISVTGTPSSTFSSPSSTSSSTASGNNDNTSPNIASSASLYLYTFLATLVLLLGVSAAIVVRSLLLRRRHRRMIEEAIRNGTYVPPNVLAHSRGRVDLAKKPKMWEATVLREWNGKEGGWSEIVPVSASISSPGSTLPLPVTANTSYDASSDLNASSAAGTSTVASRVRAATVMPGRVALGAWRLISPAARLPSDSSGPAIPNNFLSAETKPRQPHQTLPFSETTTPTHFDVAVLIAMPGALAAAAHRAKEGGEEEDLPHVEVGMAEVVVPPGASSTQDVQEGSSSMEGSQV